MKEKLKIIFTENRVLQNMTKVIVCILWFLWTFFVWQQLLIFLNWYFNWNLNLDLNILSFAQVLWFSWLVLAFWYWYKKYERDKELQILEKYWKKYDELKKSKNYWWILSLCEEEFYLYKKWYISEDLWKRIKHKIDKNIWYILKEISNKTKENMQKKWIEEWLKSENKYLGIFMNDDVVCSWKWFWKYILSRLNEIKEDREKIVNWKIDYWLFEDEKIIQESREFIAIINLLVPEIKKMIKTQKEYFNN